MLSLGFYSCKKDVHDKLLFLMSTDLYMAGNSKTPMFWILPWWNLTTPCLPFYCGFTLDRGRHSGVEFGLTTRIFWRGFMPMGSSLSQRTLLPFNLKHKLTALIIFTYANIYIVCLIWDSGSFEGDLCLWVRVWVNEPYYCLTLSSIYSMNDIYANIYTVCLI